MGFKYIDEGSSRIFKQLLNFRSSESWEIRNPNIEIRNKFEFFNVQMTKTRLI
jgi:hypothetical protein